MAVLALLSRAFSGNLHAEVSVSLWREGRDLQSCLEEKLSDVTCGEFVEHTFRGFMESAEDTFERPYLVLG